MWDPLLDPHPPLVFRGKWQINLGRERTLWPKCEATVSSLPSLSSVQRAPGQRSRLVELYSAPDTRLGRGPVPRQPGSLPCSALAVPTWPERVLGVTVWHGQREHHCWPLLGRAALARTPHPARLPAWGTLGVGGVLWLRGRIHVSVKILRNASLPSFLFSQRDDRKWMLPWVTGTQGLSCFSGGGDRSFCAVCAFLSLVPSSRCCKLKRAQVAYLRQKAVSLTGKLIMGKKEVLIAWGVASGPLPCCTECPPWHQGPQALAPW